MNRNKIAVAMLLIVAVGIVGCSKQEPGLSSQQTEQILQVQKTLAAERTIVAAEHAAVGRARDDLEKDRRIWNERERKDPIIAESIRMTGLILACCVPLLLVAMVARAGRSSSNVVAPEEAVLIELLEAEPPRLPRPDTRQLDRLSDHSG